MSKTIRTAYIIYIFSLTFMQSVVYTHARTLKWSHTEEMLEHRARVIETNSFSAKRQTFRSVRDSVRDKQIVCFSLCPLCLLAFFPARSAGIGIHVLEQLHACVCAWRAEEGGGEAIEQSTNFRRILADWDKTNIFYGVWAIHIVTNAEWKVQLFYGGTNFLPTDFWSWVELSKSTYPIDLHTKIKWQNQCTTAWKMKNNNRNKS